jgi:ribosomal protein S18 acetylase RimI-like enzyme
MPRLTDPQDIRARLEEDRPWTAFALADLEPPYSAHASWFVPPGNPHAIGLLYGAFGTPLVLCSGQSDEWPDLLREIDHAVGEAREVYVVVRPELLPVIRFQYQTIEEREMIRMVLHPGAFRPVYTDAATRIGPAGLDLMKDLFAGDTPPFFLPSMLADGSYYGILEDDRLVAAAGTHVLAHDVSVAALGNIYTRPDRRGRGLAAAVTSAVVRDLIEMGIATIVLNVRDDNHPAVRVYERLGFERYCTYFEVPARRVE